MFPNISESHLLTSHRPEVISSCLRQIVRKVPGKQSISVFRWKCRQSISVLSQWSNTQWNDSETASATATRHPRPQREAAVCYDQRGAGQSLHGQQCCHCLPGGATQSWWLYGGAPSRNSEIMVEKKHKSTNVGHWFATFHQILWNIMNKNT